MKRIWILMVTFAVILCMSLTAMAEQEPKEELTTTTAIVATKSSPLSLRETPNYDGAILCEIPKGTTVVVLEKGVWPKVEYNGKTGFVNGKYLQYQENGALLTDHQDIVGTWVATDNENVTIQLNADGTGGNYLAIPNSDIVAFLAFTWTLNGQELTFETRSGQNITRFIGDYDGETIFIGLGGEASIFIRQDP